MIYFDAGATTLEKPAAVGRAMARAAHTMSSPGRGSYPASRLAGETAYLCRQEAAELLEIFQWSGADGAAGGSPAGKRRHHRKRHPWPEPGYPVFAGSRGPGGDLRI